ncbi:MAG: glycosyltransferase [Acidobacteria bacterium]|nr:glycosyltransferase [Acidobacteriota bacterium]
MIATTPSAEAAATPPKQGGELKVSLLTFEPERAAGDIGEFERIKAEFLAEGIEWDWLPYHKRPSAAATAWDIFRGAFYIWRRIGRFDVLHGRVHVPTLMGALARKFSLRKPKLLFDIRGFFPEEYTDAGIWPEGGLLYRGAKRVERWLMKESDAFVVLTEKAREQLFPESKEAGYDKLGRPVEVIPCCVDLERFASATPETRERKREELGITGKRVMVYVGSFGGWYLTKETADIFGAFRERYPNAFAMILTQSRPKVIEPLLREAGYLDGEYLINQVPSAEIPEYLVAADVAVSFIKPCYSKQASSPTKNAEYLACGLPIIANSGVGDVDLLVEGHGVGALIANFDRESYFRAFDRIESLGDIAGRCRTVASDEFDLKTVGGRRYGRIYSSLFSA